MVLRTECGASSAERLPCSPRWVTTSTGAGAPPLAVAAPSDVPHQSPAGDLGGGLPDGVDAGPSVIPGPRPAAPDTVEIPPIPPPGRSGDRFRTRTSSSGTPWASPTSCGRRTGRSRRCTAPASCSSPGASSTATPPWTSRPSRTPATANRPCGRAAAALPSRQARRRRGRLRSEVGASARPRVGMTAR